jgi:hypothetical protein|tara:strand:+ start:195 stop:401 length:207 start_codon:yes stop_codon:yes gene_type:complete
MSAITITETGILAIISLGIGFIIACCKQSEQSRCKHISLCCGLINCERQPLSGETILELNQESKEEPV